MAIQIVPILKALAPLATNASGIAANLRAARQNTDLEERIDRLEDETIKLGELVSDLTGQVTALAEQVREQEKRERKRARQTRVTLGLGVVALCVSLVALAWTMIA